MKILTITNCPLDPTLGSGKTVIRYSEGLKSLGHSVQVLQPQDYELARSLRKGKRLRQSLGSWRRISEELKAEQYDLIEFFGAEYWLAISKLSARPERPLLVAHTNGLELLHYQREQNYLPQPKSAVERLRRKLHSAVFEPLMRISFEKTDRFVSLCEDDRQFVVNAGLYRVEETEVVAPGLDDEFLHTAEPTSTGRDERIVSIGSWTARKGIEIFVKVAAEILSNRPEVSLDIYGAHTRPEVILGSFPEAVRSRILIEDGVTNVELSAALSQAKVFFFPTQYEGYGMALAEAMSCGSVPVTTPTGFGADLIDGQEALICGFTDADRMLAAIESLLDDEPLQAHLALNGWKRTRSLDWTSNIAKLERTYQGWLANGKAGCPGAESSTPG